MKRSTALFFIITISISMSACGPGQILRPTVSPTPSVTITPTSTLTQTNTIPPTKTVQPQDIWISLGPEGGNIRSLVIDPLTPTTLYAGTDRNRLFKSMDGGEHWNAISGIYPTFMAPLAIDPRTPTTIYVGNQISTDGGQSWDWGMTGLPYDSYFVIEYLVIDPLTPANIYLATTKGVYKGTDTGQGTWSAGTGLPNITATTLAIDLTTPSTIYAGTEGSGVFKTTDSGGHWISIGLRDKRIVHLAINPSDTSIVYAATQYGVYKSSEGGENWSPIDLHQHAHDFKTIVIDPVTPSILYVGSAEGVFKTTDSGASWSAVNTGLSNTRINTLAISPRDSSMLYAGTWDGVYKSSDGGGNWSPVNTGLVASNILTLVVDPAHHTTLFAMSDAGLITSTDSGVHWSPVDPNSIPTDTSSPVMDPAVPSTRFALSQWGISRSTDDGANWSAINTGLPASSESVIAAVSLVIDPQTPTNYYVGTWKGVYKSIDSGEHWVATGLTNLQIWFLVIDPVTPSTLYAGGWVGQTVFKLVKSINAGRTWNPIDAGLPTSTSIYGLVIDPNMPSTLYVPTWFGLYKSSDGGAHWSEINFGLEVTVSASVLAIDPLRSTLYAATSGGLLRSSDGGNNWSKFDSGLSYPGITAFAFDPETHTTLYAATNGGGIYVIHIVPTWELLPQPPLYDDFEGAILDSSRWQPGNYPIPLQFSYLQKDGVLVFEGQSNNEASYFELNMIQPNLRTIDQVRVFEAQLKVPMRADGVGSEISMMLWADLPFQGWRVTDCSLAALTTDAPFFACATRRAPPLTDPVHFSQYIPIQFGQWYTVRIEMNPDNGAIQTYLDGILVDHYMPMDASVILNLYFRPSFVFYTNPLATLMFEIDNVRITGGALP